MKFEKIFTAGKDYIYIPDCNTFNMLTKEDIQQLCNRKKGIGGDGIFTFNINGTKITQIKAFLQNGESMQDPSSACIYAVFSLFCKTHATEHEIDGDFDKKIRLFSEIYDNHSSFSCEFNYSDNDDHTLRKTEIGNRILTLTKISLYGTHTIHFSECIDELNINYLGKHISRHSLFNKKADITLAQKTDTNTFMMTHYENNTGNPRPVLSVFAATALAACKNNLAEYLKEIHLVCNDTDIYAFCDKNNSCVLQGNIRKVFCGEIQYLP